MDPILALLLELDDLLLFRDRFSSEHFSINNVFRISISVDSCIYLLLKAIE